MCDPVGNLLDPVKLVAFFADDLTWQPPRTCSSATRPSQLVLLVHEPNDCLLSMMSIC